MKLIYPACFYPHENQEGYTVEVPDLPGCVTEGSNLIDAIAMATDAACGWVLDELEDGKKLPKASSPNDITIDTTISNDGFINLLVLDMDTYTEKFGKKSVRKNVTIPAYLNTFVEQNGYSLSQVLQEALKEKLALN